MATGTENLDAMAGAVRYHSYLLGYALPWIARAGAREVVDVGAGIGTYSEMLRSRGYHVTAVEPDSEARAEAASRASVAVADSGDVASASKDAAISFNVLEHVADHSAVVSEMARVVRPGGAIVVIVPARLSLWTPMDDLVGHVRRYDRAMLRSLFDRARLEVREVRDIDLPGALVTKAYKHLPRADGEIDSRRMRLFDRVVVPISSACDRLRLPYGKNLVLAARVPSVAKREFARLPKGASE